MVETIQQQLDRRRRSTGGAHTPTQQIHSPQQQSAHRRRSDTMELEMRIHSLANYGGGGGAGSQNELGLSLREIRESVEAEIELDKAKASAAAAEEQNTTTTGSLGRRNERTRPLRTGATTKPRSGTQRPKRSTSLSSKNRANQREKRMRARRASSEQSSIGSPGSATTSSSSQKSRMPRPRRDRPGKLASSLSSISYTSKRSSMSSSATTPKRRSFTVPSTQEEMSSRTSFQVVAASCGSMAMLDGSAHSAPAARTQRSQRRSSNKDRPRKSTAAASAIGMPTTTTPAQLKAATHYPLRRATRRMTTTSMDPAQKVNQAPTPIQAKCSLWFQQEVKTPPKRRGADFAYDDSNLDDSGIWTPNYKPKPVDKKLKYKTMLATNKKEKPETKKEKRKSKKEEEMAAKATLNIITASIGYSPASRVQRRESTVLSALEAKRKELEAREEKIDETSELGTDDADLELISSSPNPKSDLSASMPSLKYSPSSRIKKQRELKASLSASLADLRESKMQDREIQNKKHQNWLLIHNKNIKKDDDDESGDDEDSTSSSNSSDSISNSRHNYASNQSRYSLKAEAFPMVYLPMDMYTNNSDDHPDLKLDDSFATTDTERRTNVARRLAADWDDSVQSIYVEDHAKDENVANTTKIHTQNVSLENVTKGCNTTMELVPFESIDKDIAVATGDTATTLEPDDSFNDNPKEYHEEPHAQNRDFGGEIDLGLVAVGEGSPGTNNANQDEVKADEANEQISGSAAISKSFLSAWAAEDAEETADEPPTNEAEEGLASPAEKATSTDRPEPSHELMAEQLEGQILSGAQPHSMDLHSLSNLNERNEKAATTDIASCEPQDAEKTVVKSVMLVEKCQASSSADIKTMAGESVGPVAFENKNGAGNLVGKEKIAFDEAGVGPIAKKDTSVSDASRLAIDEPALDVDSGAEHSTCPDSATSKSAENSCQEAEGKEANHASTVVGSVTTLPSSSTPQSSKVDTKEAEATGESEHPRNVESGASTAPAKKHISCLESDITKKSSKAWSELSPAAGHAPNFAENDTADFRNENRTPEGQVARVRRTRIDRSRSRGCSRSPVARSRKIVNEQPLESKENSSRSQRSVGGRSVRSRRATELSSKLGSLGSDITSDRGSSASVGERSSRSSRGRKFLEERSRRGEKPAHSSSSSLDGWSSRSSRSTIERSTDDTSPSRDVTPPRGSRSVRTGRTIDLATPNATTDSLPAKRRSTRVVSNTTRSLDPESFGKESATSAWEKNTREKFTRADRSSDAQLERSSRGKRSTDEGSRRGSRSGDVSRDRSSRGSSSTSEVSSRGKRSMEASRERSSRGKRSTDGESTRSQRSIDRSSSLDGSSRGSRSTEDERSKDERSKDRSSRHRRSIDEGSSRGRRSLPEQSEEEKLLAEKAKMWAKARRAKFGPPPIEPSTRANEKEGLKKSKKKRPSSRDSTVPLPPGSSFLAEVAAAMNSKSVSQKVRRKSRKPSPSGEETGSVPLKPCKIKSKGSSVTKSPPKCGGDFEGETASALPVLGSTTHCNSGISKDEPAVMVARGVSKKRTSLKPRTGGSCVSVSEAILKKTTPASANLSLPVVASSESAKVVTE